MTAPKRDVERVQVLENSPERDGPAARRVVRAVRDFDARLSAGPWRGWLFGPQGQGREYRGKPAEWTLRLALNNHRRSTN
jgi:hypothetical protein